MDPSSEVAEATPTNPLGRGIDLFTTRSNDVFASLGKLEEKHSAFLKTASADGRMSEEGLLKTDPDEGESTLLLKERARAHQTTSKKSLADTRYSDCQQSPRGAWQSRGGPGRHGGKISKGRSDFEHQSSPSFRLPQSRPPHKRRCQPVPDHKRHPEKYTHYSLSDVSETEMSERSNSRAAFAFLEERRLLREKEEQRLAGLPVDEEQVKFDAESAACSQGVITFSNRHKSGRQDQSKPRNQDKTDSCPLSSSFDSIEEASAQGTQDISSLDSGNHDDSVKESSVANTFSTFKVRNMKRSKRSIRRKTDDDSD